MVACLSLKSCLLTFLQLSCHRENTKNLQRTLRKQEQERINQGWLLREAQMDLISVANVLPHPYFPLSVLETLLKMPT